MKIPIRHVILSTPNHPISIVAISIYIEYNKISTGLTSVLNGDMIFLEEGAQERAKLSIIPCFQSERHFMYAFT